MTARRTPRLRYAPLVFGAYFVVGLIRAQIEDTLIGGSQLAHAAIGAAVVTAVYVVLVFVMQWVRSGDESGDDLA